MVSVIIGNSYSQITGLTSEQMRGLRDALSYSPNLRAAYFSGGYVKKKYLIDKKGFFPTGLRSRVNTWLNSTETKSHWMDGRKEEPAPSVVFTWKKKFTPYKEQTAAVHMGALGTDSGTICMPTGTGKSLTMALLIKERGLRTLVVVPNVELKRQLTETLQEYFGPTKDIVIENIDSPRLKTLKDFDMLLIDECHHSASKTYHKLNKSVWTNIYHRYCFTATPWRTQEEEQIVMESITGLVIYRLNYDTAVKNGLIVPIEAYSVDMPKGTYDALTWRAFYNEAVVHNEPRNRAIAELIGHLKDQNTLILVKEIEHGNILSALTGVPFVNGQDEESRPLIQEFSSGKIGALIATTGVFGEGTDSRAARFVIIACLGKSKNAFMQWCGRVVRRYEDKTAGNVILLRDQGHKWFTAHYRAQVKILLDEYGVKPISLDI